MIAFIDDHRQAYGVEPICRALPIAPSTDHAHAARRADPSRLPDRVRRDADLRVEIRRVFEDNFRVYGVRKVWRESRREGFSAARCTVARLMRNIGLRGAIRDKPLRTTISDKAALCPLDRVNRQFRASAPDRLWLADFTYVATWAWLRLCRLRRRRLRPADRRLAGQPDEGDRVEGEGTAELLDDGTIEIELAYDNNDEVVLKAKRDPSSTACSVANS
jgi:HTH-like domain